MTREEVVVSLGLDTRPFNQRLGSFLQTTGTKLNSAVSGWARSMSGAFAAAFSFAAAEAWFSRVSKRMDDIKRQAETSGLDTDLVQDFQNIAKAAGISERSVEKMMGTFVKGLKAGANPSEELRKIADALSQIKDPGERARFAVEHLGEAGLKLIPILAKGSKEIEILGSRFGRFSKEQIERIDAVSDRLDEMKARADVSGATVFNAFFKIADAANMLSEAALGKNPLAWISASTIPSFNLLRTLKGIGKVQEEINDAAQLAANKQIEAQEILKEKAAEKGSMEFDALLKYMELSEKIWFEQLTTAEKLQVLTKKRGFLEKALAQTEKGNLVDILRLKGEILLMDERIRNLGQPDPAAPAAPADGSPLGPKDRWLQEIIRAREEWLKKAGLSEEKLKTMASGIESLVKDGIKVKDLIQP
jgi:hypothetical protein